MPQDMDSQCEERLRDLGFQSFSAYVQHLVREDLLKRGTLVRSIGVIQRSEQGGYSMNDKQPAATGNGTVIDNQE